MSFLPVYNRAGLSRTVTLVVALSLTAVSTGAFARAPDAVDLHGDLDRGNGAAIGSQIPVSLEPRMAGLACYDSAAGSISAAAGSKPQWRKSTHKHSAIPRRRGRSNELA